MTVTELYDSCSNWLPWTTVSVCSNGAVVRYASYREVINRYGNSLVDNFCWFPSENIFAINLR